MRTFDDAIHYVLSDEYDSLANVIATKDEQIANKEFTEYIKGAAMDLLRDVALELIRIKRQPTDADAVEVMTHICARLHETFAFGMFTGITMEREDERTPTV